MALSKTTQDHDEIRQWAEARGGKPAEVASTERNGQTGILRIEFPGAVNANDSALKEIAWEEFFAKFDASGLSLVYQEQTAEGATSNFNKLIHPENASGAAKKSAKTATASKSASPKKAAPAKKAVAAKKSPAKKAPPAKKAAPAKKSASVKVSAKKSAAKSTAAKKSPAKKTPATKIAAKKNSAKRTIATKAASKTLSKKIPAKKSAGSKSSKR